MVPGMGNMNEADLDEHQLVVVEAIINSMTPGERADSHIIKGSRRRRIAAGSGTSVQDVNRLLKQFEQMKKMMKMFGRNKGKMKRLMAGGGLFQ